MNSSVLFRDLLKSWKSSIGFFLPPTIKPFFLVTVKTILQTYSILFEQLWPLITIAGIAQLGYMWFCIPSKLGCFFTWIIAHTLSMLIVFLMLLIIRPSIKAKALDYYRDYIPHFLLFWIVSLFFAYCNAPHCLSSPLFIFYMFFLLDTPFDLKNIFLNGWRSLKMIIFGLPYCGVVWIISSVFLAFSMIILSLPLMVLFQNIDVALQAAQFVIYFLFPVVYAWYANFYVKRVRDQFSLYF